MNVSERLIGILNFVRMEGNGVFVETFFPWTLTAERWINEGLSERFTAEYLYPQAKSDRTEDTLMI